MPTIIYQYTEQDANEALMNTWENLREQSQQTEYLEVGSPPARTDGPVINPFIVVSSEKSSGKLYAHNEQSTGAPSLPHLRFEIGDRRFDRQDEDELSAVTNDTADLVSEVYAQTKTQPAFVYGMAKKMPGVLAELDEYPVEASQADGDVTEVNFLTWLSIFPPSLVDTYGRETLLSAPAWHVEELDDGSILLVEWADPTVIRDNEVQQYLGFDPEE